MKCLVYMDNICIHRNLWAGLLWIAQLWRCETVLSTEINEQLLQAEEPYSHTGKGCVTTATDAFPISGSPILKRLPCRLSLPLPESLWDWGSEQGSWCLKPCEFLAWLPCGLPSTQEYKVVFLKGVLHWHIKEFLSPNTHTPLPLWTSSNDLRNYRAFQLPEVIISPPTASTLQFLIPCLESMRAACESPPLHYSQGDQGQMLLVST